ncbi:sin3 histone deacetylase corepressor complex component SDS3-like [Daktulosphaira vitifoliae]|uniref:sin3 histone deacetylase corepressor complex component SDS3-like n=1 Tax=Daktulosphaira vitifoliae TaxID=58002 RepID=UPI0021A9D17A|nr:sin3 histone deacetylase corepressor complex component SDS3-like [Daktulosphaira vitifoliae]
MSINENNMSPSSSYSIDDEELSNNIGNKDISDSDDEGKENREKRTEIQEQVYQDKLAGIQKQLQEGTHVEYVKQLKKLEVQQKNHLLMNNIWRDCLLEAIEREFVKERRLAHKEFDDRNNELTETLVTELNERKKAIEHDNLTMELAPDSIDQKPAMTRKLRRRPNDPVVPAPQEKRRKPPPVSNIYYLLDEREIEQDVKAIQESLASICSNSSTTTTATATITTTISSSNNSTASSNSTTTTTVKTRDTVNSSSVRKPGFLNSGSSSGNMSPKKSQNSDSESSSAIPDTRIEDGKLLFEKRWYHRGQPVFVEGRQMSKFPAVISAIGNETIWVKKTSDNSKFRINLLYLSKGKMSIKRRAAV